MISSQRHLEAACRRLVPRPQSGTWFRAVEPQFWQVALQTAQTKTYPSRFNAAQGASGPFETLYLAEDSMVALFEVQALFGDPVTPGGIVPHPRKSLGVLNVTVSLTYIVDLTEVSAQQELETTAQELTGDWVGYRQRGSRTTVKEPIGIAPTQALGAAFHSVAGLEGFRTISARLPYNEILVVFPQKMQPGSLIRFSDPATGQTLSLP